ncbi:sugar ABC transporter permease [Sanguibacter sp. 25GB23B1]|uniref:carbohydrate ABC transporter permease n=1 Tax=unclassified Sanguibacter TaxID=2645534 RepID=UPI0032AFB1AD
MNAPSLNTSPSRTAALSPAPAGSTTPPRPRRRLAYPGERALRNVVVGVVVLFIVVLLLVPIGIAAVGSLHLWNPLNGTFDFTGLANYRRLFSDQEFWTSSVNTLVFGSVAIVGRLVLGLALAYALYSKMTRCKTFFRAVFYMPTVTPLVAVAYVWQLMYNPRFGAINTFFGLDINWLLDSRYAMGAILVMTIWKDFGYAVILFLAGLYAVPDDVLEAAAVDGANAWTRFRRIIVPLLAPMTLFIAVTSTIGYLQAFVQVLVLTDGGPGTSTRLISFMIYDEAFVNYNFGYASAIAFVLLLFTAILTWLNFRVSAGSGVRPPRRRAGRSAVTR